MATQTEPVTHEAEAAGAVPLHDVGWSGYKTLLRLRGERRRPRMVYLDGTVYLTSPSFPHELLADRSADLVKAVAEAFRIKCVSARSTTFRRKAEKAGAEGDATFYIAKAHGFRGRDVFERRSDPPPPDLAIEAVYSHAAAAAIEVYRRLGVPEVWVADQFQVTIHILDSKTRYQESAVSLAFPFLKAAEIHAWIIRDPDDSWNDWIEALRAWVNETLKPRAAAAGTKPE